MSSKEEQTITVTTGGSATVPGGLVNAVVTITGDPDDKVRGATARLVRTALRRVTQTNVTSHGYHNSLISDDVVVAEAPLSDPHGKVVPGDHAVSFALPDDALPSATKVVWWSVRAVIDRRHGIDVKAQAPVEVLAGPQRFEAEGNGEARYHGERCLELELANRSLRPGGAITGNVVVRPPRAMTLTNLLVSFARTFATKDGTDAAALVVQGLLDEPLHLEAGHTKSYPFDLTLPDDAEPTVLGKATTPPCSSYISWTVMAVAVPLRSPDPRDQTNPVVHLGINVYNAEAAPPLRQDTADDRVAPGAA